MVAVFPTLLNQATDKQAKASAQFLAVQEQNDEFLALFPHRFDYIYAAHPEVGRSPNWFTESRHPLSDRLIRQGSYLYGVRFGAQTNYCLLDIDSGSAYHPQRDSLAIDRILAALEPIGLVRYIACTSSYSTGIHLYFPFQEQQSSWELASVVQVLLENAGLMLKPGQLEIFPNPKPYLIEGNPSLFNAHRLPLQAGSYVLNDEFQPISSYTHHFVARWKWVQEHNAVDAKVIKRIIKQAKRKCHQVSGKADKFINDLNAEIEAGWTDHGQTNRLLGRITMRTYIFHHILAGGDPLTGQRLIDTIVSIARSLPGYREWCRHQHEIEHRVEEWVRCIENSHYFRYGDRQGKYKDKLEQQVDNLALMKGLPTWNQQQSSATRERIRLAIADLLEKNMLPATATARFHKLTEYKIGGGSLYRHRDLWHPDYLTEISAVENAVENDLEINAVENPPHPPNSLELGMGNCVDHTFPIPNLTSLFPLAGGNPFSAPAFSDLQFQVNDRTGGNSLQPVDAEQSAQLSADDAIDSAQAMYQTRMQQYLQSGDPILMAEARLSQSPDRERLAERAQRSTVSSPQLLLSAATEFLADDLSDLLAAVSVRLRQLQWTPGQVSRELEQRFGKTRQSRLSEMELMQWLEILQNHVNS